MPIYEPGLEELVRRNIKEGRLSFTTELKSAVSAAMVSFIAVGTPMSKNGAADLSGVMRAAEEIAKAVAGYHIIAIKSTVPVGTNDRVREIVAKAANHRVDVCSVSRVSQGGLGDRGLHAARPGRDRLGQRTGDRDPARTARRRSCAPTTR